MVIEPVVTTSAVGLPDTMPYSPEDTTAILAGPPAPAEGGGEIVEEIAPAAGLQQRAEQHEHEGVGGGDAQRQAEDAVGREHRDLEQVPEADLAVLHHPAEMIAPQVVGDEHQHDRGKPEAGRAPRDLQGEQENDRGEGNVRRAERVEQHDAIDDGVRLGGEVESDADGQEGEREIGPRRLAVVGILEGAGGEEAERQHAREEQDGERPRIDDDEGGGADDIDADQERERQEDPAVRARRPPAASQLPRTSVR